MSQPHKRDVNHLAASPVLHYKYNLGDNFQLVHIELKAGGNYAHIRFLGHICVGNKRRTGSYRADVPRSPSLFAERYF